jgi:hypothetical protein
VVEPEAPQIWEAKRDLRGDVAEGVAASIAIG